MSEKRKSCKSNRSKCKLGERIGSAHRVHSLEGRDAAGKGGTIKRFMEHLTRAARAWWPWKPTETERGQWYFQRYIQNLPTSAKWLF